MATTVSNQHSMTYTILRLQDEILSRLLDKLVCSYMRKDNSNENEEDKTCTFIKDDHEFDLIDESSLEHCNKQENPDTLNISLQRERFMRESVNSPPSFGTDIAAKAVALEDTATRSTPSPECSHTGSYVQEMVTHHEDFSYDLQESSEPKTKVVAHHEGYSCNLPVSSGLELLREEVSKRADEDFYEEFYCKQAATQYISSAWKYACVVPASNTLHSLPLRERKRWEVWRLSSFASVKHLAPFAIRMAQSGFYYDSELKEIKCFSCGVMKSDWTRSDKPALVHLDISPLCAHAGFRDDTNIPLDPKSSTLLPTVSGANEVAKDNEQGNGSSASENASSSSLEPPSSLSKSFQNNVSDASGHESVAEPATDKGEVAQSKSVSEAIVNTTSLAMKDANCISSHPTLLRKHEKDLPVHDVTKANIFPHQTDLVVYHLTGSSQSVDAGHTHYPVQAERPHDESEQQSGSRSRADNLNNIASISPQYNIVEKTFRNLNLEKAVYLSFVSMKARLLSYECWVFGSIQNPVTLADCGFYYLGTKDSVRCFYCGVTVRNWRSSDDPWVVHILFRFSCEYVIAVKGDDFIRQTLIRKGIGASQNTIINDQEGGSPNVDESIIDPAGALDTQDDASGAAPHSPAPAVNDIITPIASTHSQQSSDNSRVSISSQSLASQTPSRRSTSAGNKASISAHVDGVSKSNPTKGVSTPRIASLIMSAVSSLVGGSHSLLEPLAVFQTSMPSALGGGRQSLQTDSVLEPSQSNTTVVDPAAVSPPLGAKPMERGQRSTLSQDSATQGNPLVNPNNDGGRSRCERIADANRRLRDQRTCKICNNSTVDTIFLPCGHLCTCSACASTIRYCCLCKDEIKGTAHVYLE